MIFCFLLETMSSFRFVVFVEKGEFVLSNDGINVLDEESAPFYVVSIHESIGGIEHHIIEAALLSSAKRLKINLRIEVETPRGLESILLPDEIENATAVLLVTNKNMNVARFVGKKTLVKSIEEVLKHSELVIQELLNNELKILEDTDLEIEKVETSRIYKALARTSVLIALFVMAGGIFVFCSYIFGLSSFDRNSPDFVPFSSLLMSIGGGVALQLVLPLLTAFLAYYLGGKQAFAPGLINGFLVLQASSGFVGALLAGFVTAWIVYLVDKGFVPMKPKWEGIKQLFFIPILAIFLSSAFTTYFINDIIYALSVLIQNSIINFSEDNVFTHFFLGMLIGIDFVGPFSKIAYQFMSELDVNKSYSVLASITAAGMAIPLGVALSSVFFRKSFHYVERFYGKVLFIFSIGFIPEGVIPIAIRTPISFLVSSIISGGTAAAVTHLFKIKMTKSYGGLFAIDSVVGNVVWFLLSILVGAIVMAILLVFTRRWSMRK